MSDSAVKIMRDLMAALPGGGPRAACELLRAGHVMSKNELWALTDLVSMLPVLVAAHEANPLPPDASLRAHCLDGRADEIAAVTTVDVEQIVANALHSDDEWGVRYDSGGTGRLHTPEDDIRAAVLRYLGRRIVAEMSVTPGGRFAPEDSSRQ
jgi:hypothetical protein